MPIYFHYYAIKFEINKELNKKEQIFLKNPLYQMDNKNSGILVCSINNLSDNMMYIPENEEIYVGERRIPLELFQKRVQKSELIYVWNELLQFFYSHIKFYAIERAYVTKKLTYDEYNKKNAIIPKLLDYKNFLYSTNKNSP